MTNGTVTISGLIASSGNIEVTIGVDGVNGITIRENGIIVFSQAARPDTIDALVSGVSAPRYAGHISWLSCLEGTTNEPKAT